MGKIFSLLLQKIKKWSLLRVSIIVLGNLVIFGLGFALGLNYVQSRYLAKKDDMHYRDALNNNRYNDSNNKESDDFTFFYGLRVSDNNSRVKSNDKILNQKKEYTYNQSNIDNKKQESQINTTKVEQFAYTIQLYSFKSSDVAEKKINELKKKGYSAYQSKIDFGNNDIYYRVRVGQFKNREDATEILVRILASETNEAYITRN